MGDFFDDGVAFGVCFSLLFGVALGDFLVTGVCFSTDFGVFFSIDFAVCFFIDFGVSFSIDFGVFLFADVGVFLFADVGVLFADVGVFLFEDFGVFWFADVGVFLFADVGVFLSEDFGVLAGDDFLARLAFGASSSSSSDELDLVQKLDCLFLHSSHIFFHSCFTVLGDLTIGYFYLENKGKLWAHGCKIYPWDGPLIRAHCESAECMKCIMVL